MWDVIVIGGGHAGVEAAHAVHRMGGRVLLITLRRDNLGQLSCNPAIGGLGKGHLVGEIDALGGLMGIAADRSGLHFRLLNRSRGPAVQGPRIQVDRQVYRSTIESLMMSVPLLEAEVRGLLIESGRCIGVSTSEGSHRAGRTVLTSGTFLGGRMFRGEEVTAGGRVGERAALPLGRQLAELGLPMLRLKTGTPPRLDGRTLDWHDLDRQPSDADPAFLHYGSTSTALPQLDCYLTRTTPRTHDIVASALHRSPLRTGAIRGLGPRYCPSIEDKVDRFADRDSHQVFLEPEGLATPLIYPNGISTSLPDAVQRAMVNSLPGCAGARIVQPGYAVEYDCIDPRALSPLLECEALPGLFLAGQINGTTGYEEAAGQGIWAGVAAFGSAMGAEPSPLSRREAYVGVMIDDLTRHGVSEPYRLFTSRAEHRLRLRVDNADLRLGERAVAWGLLTKDQAAVQRRRRHALARARAALQAQSFLARDLGLAGGDGLKRSGWEWLAIAGGPEALAERVDDVRALAPADRLTLVIDARYEPYIARHEQEQARLAAHRGISLEDVDLNEIAGLSGEMAERLAKARPKTLGEAMAVPGLTPAAVTALFAHLHHAA